MKGAVIMEFDWKSITMILEAVIAVILFYVESPKSRKILKAVIEGIEEGGKKLKDIHGENSRKEVMEKITKVAKHHGVHDSLEAKVHWVTGKLKGLGFWKSLFG